MGGTSDYASFYTGTSRVQRADDSLAYVRRIAVNAALKQQRRAFRRREAVVESLPELASTEAQDAVAAHDEMWLAVPVGRGGRTRRADPHPGGGLGRHVLAAAAQDRDDRLVLLLDRGSACSASRRAARTAAR